MQYFIKIFVKSQDFAPRDDQHTRRIRLMLEYPYASMYNNVLVKDGTL